MEKNDNYYSKFKIDDSNEYIKEDGLTRELNDYFKILSARSELITHAHIAGMDQVVTSDDVNYVIGTQALDTCYGILLYDRKNKYGIVGHADPSNIIGITIEMLKHLPQNEEATIEYAIIPGYRATEQKRFKEINEIIAILHTYSSIYPKTKFISLNSSLQPTMPNALRLLCYDFAFDTRTGKDVSSIVFADTTKEQGRHI